MRKSPPGGWGTEGLGLLRVTLPVGPGVQSGPPYRPGHRGQAVGSGSEVRPQGQGRLCGVRVGARRLPGLSVEHGQLWAVCPFWEWPLCALRGAWLTHGTFRSSALQAGRAEGTLVAELGTC